MWLCSRVGLGFMLEAGQLGVAGCRHGALAWHKEKVDAEASDDGTTRQMLSLLWHLYIHVLLAKVWTMPSCFHMTVQECCQCSH